ncbi:MAG: hypothetical protein ACTHJM_07710 [Marmoricola sp.]
MSRGLRWARSGVIALVTLDLLALAAFSVHETRVTVRTVTPLRQSQLTSTPANALPGGVTPINTAPPAGVVVAFNSSPVSSAPASPNRPSTPPRTPSKPTPPGGSGTGSAGPAACPIKLQKPTQQGGLQSLISLAPAFGPFSAEAFAAASAYQPLLQLIGPILAQYPSLEPTLAPVVTPLVTSFASGSNALFALLNPLYAPYRTQVLQQESKLAAYFAPYAEKLANSPLGGCIVDLEAGLVSATKKS